MNDKLAPFLIAVLLATAVVVAVYVRKRDGSVEPRPVQAQGEVIDAAEEQWCDARRADVAEYLLREGVEHGEVGDWPAWHVFPYVSIWAIESKRAPGQVGWWAIAGDLPTDYVSAGNVKHPRDAVRAFADRWDSLSVDLANGKGNDAMRIGKPEDWPKLAPMLKARAGVLRGYADDDRIWSDL